jgi:hypothetical protein
MPARRCVCRAGRLGYQATEAADLQVIVEGRAIRPAMVKERLHRFLLPAGAAAACIVSRSEMPVHLDPDSLDRRRLGVRIGGIVVGGRPVALDGAALGEGFHPVERRGAQQWRWTDGAARLLLPGAPRSTVLELLVLGSQASWVQEPVRQAA